ncbi:MAG TPA: 2-amino-4-hydroxy-6-hydroxymethyldihydropteridine diphosphokinase [Burkholderiales bacterium]|nr:2-amino-4-hydroxy-6-hydroxymethyldihydropteridine diphosphokinase [Burkholderiales bacterium]
MTPAYIGVGSNLDEPLLHVKQALQELAALPRSRLTRHSSLYRSSPVGFAQQPDYINAVAALQTGLDARALLGELQKLEARHGRKRSFANAPRTLDLDLLVFGERQIAEPDLVVPHPRMHERAFVLQPLIEIAPDLSIPGRGDAAAWLRRCADQKVERVAP